MKFVKAFEVDVIVVLLEELTRELLRLLFIE